MLLLKAAEHNWGLIGPGDWEKKSWKIDENGWYQFTATFRSGSPELPEIPAITEEGQLDATRFQKLKECIYSKWSDETTDACDGIAWEFKLYKNGALIRHRDLGYIYDIEPYEKMATILTATETLNPDD